MKHESFIAKKLFKGKKKGFLSFISAISVIGIILGVFSLIVVLSVMNGFSSDLTEKIIGSRAHIYMNALYGTINNYDEIRDQLLSIRGIIGVSPVSSSEIMIRTEDSVTGGILFGIDKNTVSDVIDLERNIIVGRLQDLDDESIIIGAELAHNLGLQIGEEITLISPNVKVLPNGTLLPKTVKLRVSGILKTGMYEFDKGFLYTSLNKFAELFDIPENSATSIYIKVKDIYRTKTLIQDIINTIPQSFMIRDWIDMNHNLFTALKTEKFVMGLILFMIILVAGINIINTIIMLVHEKKREIGILRAIGVTQNGIKRIFLLQGIYIGIIGTVIGSFIGITACILIDVFKIRIPGGGSVYYLDVLPIKFNIFPDYIMICLGALLISLVFSYIPAMIAGRTDPIKAIKYE